MRTFIALEVSEEVKIRARILEEEFKIDGLGLVNKEAMHITLQFLGDTSMQEAEKVVDLMQKIKFTPFKISLSGVSFFSPRLIRVIFVEIAQGQKELQLLYSKLSTALTASGIKFEEERYTPHFTIARVKRVKEMRRLREILEKNSKAGLGSFEVSSIVFKESTLTPDGPVYRDLYKLEF